MKIFINPHFGGEDEGDGGVRRVVEAQEEHLPSFGWEVVNSPGSADLIASHIVMSSEVRRAPGKPLVMHNHGLYWAEFKWPRWCHKANHDAMEAIRRADAITAPTQWVAQALRRNTLRNISVIGHGVNLDEWSYPNEHRNYVLWNKTRIDPVCDPWPLNELAHRAPDVPFISTFGDERLENIGVSGLLPYEEGKRVIASAAVYLCTARETFGIGTLEAMACGIPILGWRWGGQEEIIDHELTGYLAEPGDYEDLLVGLRYCLKHQKELGDAARKVVEERYQWKDVVGRYAVLYEHVLKAQQRPRPKISVIIPAYDLGHYLPDALDSVKVQTEQDWECIVVDDASPDDSAKIARQYCKEDKRFKLIRNKENQYLPGALNIGIAEAKGQYILPLDSDNMLPPDTLAILSQALDAKRDIHIAYGNVEFMEHTGERWHSGWPTEFRFDWQLTGRAGGTAAAADGRPANLVPSTSMFRKEVWEQTGGYRRRYRTAEDADFWTRASSYGFVAKKVTESDILIYRNRHDSMSQTEKFQDWQAWFPWSKGLAEPPAIAASGKHIPVPSFSPPLVSVVIPVGPDHRDLVVDALDSVDAQSLREWECIVVNDSGEPLRWVPSWAKVINTSGAIGVAAARNAGIKAATAPLFLPLDADDTLEPLALSTLFTMQKDLGGYIYCDWYERWEDQEIKIWNAPDYDAWKLLAEGCLHAVTALYRKEDWEEVGGFDENLPAWEDWDFQLKLAEIGVCGTRAPWPLFTYRKDTGFRREQNVTDFEGSREGIYNKWRDYYERRKELMACGGCPKGSKAAVSRIQGRPIEAANLDDKDGYLVVEYVGARQGARTFRPPSGTTYSFSASPTGRERFVLRRDADFFRVIPDFVVKEREAVPA